MDGKLREIRIYPVDLSMDASKRPWSRSSVPMTPSPELAKNILANIQKYSEPYGTRIDIENGVGIIRVPAEATVTIGTDLSIPGRGPASKPLPAIGARPGGGETWVNPIPTDPLPGRAAPQVRPN